MLCVCAGDCREELLAYEGSVLLFFSWKRCDLRCGYIYEAASCAAAGEDPRVNSVMRGFMQIVCDNARFEA